MPINDVIRLAGHANHWLAIFDKATGQALDLFRARRVASPAQRIMLIARDGGCTKPCCTVPPTAARSTTRCATGPMAATPTSTNSPSPVGRITALVDKDGWATTINTRGDVEWIPPPPLDNGQARVNYYHRPELLLRPPDEPDGGCERGP